MSFTRMIGSTILRPLRGAYALRRAPISTKAIFTDLLLLFRQAWRVPF